jgi:hypothetical protein
VLTINNPWIKHKQCHGLKFSSSALNLGYALFDIRYMLPFFTYDGHICIDSNQMVNQKLQLAETNK